MNELDFYTSERIISEKYSFHAGLERADGNTISQSKVISNGSLNQNKFIQIRADHTQNFHSVTVRFNEEVVISGVTIRFRIRNWEDVQYLAIGSNADGKYHHVKITNPLKDKWQTIWYSFEDLAFEMQNEFQNKKSLTVNDISLKLKSQKTSKDSFIDILEMQFWKEEQKKKDDWLMLSDHQRLRWKLIDKIHDYQTSSIKNYLEASERFFEDGSCPIVKNLDWPDQNSKPPDLKEVNTYRFSWHALHHVSSLILYSKIKGLNEGIEFAGKFAENWMEQSWINPDEDLKFTWYDHGTAERQISLIMIYHELIQIKDTDKSLIDNLKKIILLQGRLLESGIFYARNQVDRYHNHAMFQDVALIITALSFSKLNCAKRWLRIGVTRLEDQISQLIVRDGNYSVFVENSIGYHSGVIRLLKFSSDLIALFDKKSIIHAVYSGMEEFSKLLKYPDGRSPAQGDTQRLSNQIGNKKFLRKQKMDATILEKAGYGVIKGRDNEDFMLVFFATALSRTHKHQDNLSFTLYFDSQEWLIDPSHYSHEYEETITHYLRSASAHNMICLPNREHSIEVGLAKINGKITGTRYSLNGENLAYSENIISRNIKGDLKKLNIKFTDFVKSPLLFGRAEARLMLHCGEHIEAKKSGNNVILSCEGSDYELCITLPNEEISINKGLIGKDIVRGISGLGFMTHSSINTIECVVPINEKIEWSITKL